MEWTSMPDTLERLKTAVVDRYVIERAIGAGGMARVYLAHDLKHERSVALKVMRPELPIGPDRFTREIKLAASLRHPHILPVHDSGEADGLLYYVMPYVNGESLRQRVDREGPLPVSDIASIVGEVAGALSHAHRRGVVHRDIKPENILLEEGHAVVTDFGIAVALDERGSEKLTGQGVVIGTAAYMSPEQIEAEGDVDARSDIYSLACVTYEMLTGAPPFDGRTPLAVLSKRLSGRVAQIDRGEVPTDVDDVIAVALGLEPEDRYGTADEFASAFTAAIERSTGEVRISLPSAKAVQSIAVLPFVNMSKDVENEFFSDGITEDVINALSKVGELRVASRTSAFAFKGTGQDIRDVGKRLNVGTVLEGSVRKHGNRLRVTAQLIDVSTGFHLWSEQYDREMADVFAIQDEISCAIVETLEGTLRLSRQERLVKPQTDNMDAYSLYLKGRYFWNRRGEGLAKAKDYFLEAINEDPQYAPAHSALADTFSLLGWYRAMRPRDAFPAAMQRATRAIELDERFAEAHTSLAFVMMMHNWDWPGAESEFMKAMHLNPGHATTHHWYAEYLMAMGRLDEAIEHSMRALELDPLGLIIHVLLGMSYYFARRHDDAVAECLKTLEMDPDFTPTFIWLGQAYLQLGRSSEAIQVFRREVELSPYRSTTLAYLAAAHAMAGEGAEARRQLADLRKRSQTEYVSCFDFALIHFALNEDDDGFRWLGRAVEERAPWLVWLRVDPMFDRVRSDQRFCDVLKKMGLSSR
jgi:serine/threonine protein kinase/tetratricopeptide (TPR) repeat protein